MKNPVIFFSVLTAMMVLAQQIVLADPAEGSAAELYQQACEERIKGNLKAAMQLAAEAVAFYYQDEDWAPKNELLCAELYSDLGMTNAATVTLRQIQHLYAGIEILNQADMLRSKLGGGTGGMSE